MNNKTDWGYAIFCVVVGILALGIVFGVRFIQAKYVYHDLRCIWSECRILK